MIANAARFGAGAALAALVFLSWREPVERCWPLDTSPGAWACIGAARPPTSVRPVEAAPALGAAEAELSDEFRRAVLAPGGPKALRAAARFTVPDAPGAVAVDDATDLGGLSAQVGGVVESPPYRSLP